MKEILLDAAVIGGGPAGMAAGLELDRAGFSCAILDREDHLGGILMQCIHTGFGLQEFNEELTGPEFAERFIAKVRQSRIALYLNTMVTEFYPQKDERKELICLSPQGVLRIRPRVVILAMGCRERNRGNIRIPGFRPAGVYTAGLAQRLINIEGYIPGKEAVIIGSGDIGLIMARRLSWIGSKVQGVVEIRPYPAGLTRNIVQCLQDFAIPLYLSAQVTKIFGRDRVEGVEVTPMEKGLPAPEGRFRLACDTVLLSAGLVPENELSRAGGIELAGNGGPQVDSWLMTSAEGVFACGNVLHVHDLADWAAEESRRAGGYAVRWLQGERPRPQIRTQPGANVSYVIPSRVDPRQNLQFYLRSRIVKNDAVLELRIQDRLVKSLKKARIQPSEMIRCTLQAEEWEAPSPEAVLEFSIT